MSNVPRWASHKSKAVQRVAIETFNSTLKDTGDETKAMKASMKAMANAEKSFKKYSTKKSLITKSLNDEKRLATFVVLEPQSDDGMTTDLHGDYYDEETILDACIQFNRVCKKANLLHMIDTTAYEFVESYIAPCDIVIEGVKIKKGTWLATIYVTETPLGDKVWEGIKSGEFNGLSVQCEGVVEYVE